jgi:X-X-X-Leu-X-X-Gly heptad repeat protein
MADDKMERTMQFILEQQAQNTVSMGQLTDKMGQLSDKVDKLSDKVDRTADSVAALLTIAEIHEREIAELRESVNAVSESVKAVSESVNTVDERGRETDERLNALINTVERYISERRNGNA